MGGDRGGGLTKEMRMEWECAGWGMEGVKQRWVFPSEEDAGLEATIVVHHHLGGEGGLA